MRPAWRTCARWASSSGRLRRGYRRSTAARAGAGRPSAPLDQLDIEYECRIGRNDAARAARAVRHLRWNHERALAAPLHPRHALVPAADHLAAAQHEFERLAAVHRAVELGAVAVGLRGIVEPSRVVDHHWSLSRF